MATKTAVAASPLDRFKRAMPMAVPRIIGVSAGEIGTGKTDFWLGAPAPLVYFDFNRGLEGVVDRYLDAGKDIRVQQYDWEPIGDLTTEGCALSQDDAVELRDKVFADFKAACDAARTVVVDEEELWELYRYAEFGGPSDRPNNYSALNQRYLQLVTYAKKCTCNVGFIKGLKDEWVSVTKADGREAGKASGNRKLTGWKNLPGAVQLELWHERSKGQFNITIGKVRGSNIIGVTDTSHAVLSPKGETMFDFKTLGQLVWPNSEEADWE